MADDAVLALIRAQRGLQARIAARLGLSRPAVSRWTRIPAERLPAVEAATGIPRHILRPDICLPPPEPRPKEPCPCERERAA